jgi:hypothetical protein
MGIIMKWKYCPFCGNISIKAKEIGGKVFACPRCEWQGFPEFGDMTDIDGVAKRWTYGTKWLNPVTPEEQPVENNTSEEKSGEKKSIYDEEKTSEEKKEPVRQQPKKELTGNKILDYQVPLNMDPNCEKVPKNKEIIKKLRGKDYGDAEFM